MAPDLERASERTHLLNHGNHDRRVSAIQQEEDADSIIMFHLSKEEQALADTAVGERLPYNDYTTIDWLHDLVRWPLPPVEEEFAEQRYPRSKTRSDSDQCTQDKVSDTASSQLSTPAKDGSPRPSLAC